ncbi:MAG: AAC(3) family N-acetyltransferase [Armatimonadia bacterium]
MALTKADIVAGLKQLGVEPGMVIMVHSALASFGEVEGGADTVIDALLEVVSPEGTLVMPAMGGAPIFDVNETRSNVAEITDRFWRRPDVTRSIHPTHSAAGKGPLVDQILAGHLDQPTAIGPESPWGRVAQLDNGYILFLGCDQDRNTLLHAAEDIVNGAYLNTYRRDYYDADRRVQTLTMERFPGPHRDFIQLDSLFLKKGAMQVSKIGKAVCRLMKAGKILKLTVKALQKDPAAVLCDNPHCVDCVIQRAAIKRDRLAREDFELSALVDDVYPPERLSTALWDIQAEGISTLEISPRFAEVLRQAGPQALAAAADDIHRAGCTVAVWPCAIPWDASAEAQATAFNAACDEAAPFSPRFLKLSPWLAPDASLSAALDRAIPALQALCDLAAQRDVTILLENHPAAIWRNKDTSATVLKGVGNPRLRLAFEPAHFAQVGEHPFLGAWNHGKLKSHTAQLAVSDGCGRPGWPAQTLPGRGQGEVKELISILRCRSFDGLLTLRAGTDFTFTEAARAFWHLLDTM